VNPEYLVLDRSLPANILLKEEPEDEEDEEEHDGEKDDDGDEGYSE
jgi:hypothetical protein